LERKGYETAKELQFILELMDFLAANHAAIIIVA
jgi:hypothetical protein